MRLCVIVKVRKVTCKNSRAFKIVILTPCGKLTSNVTTTSGGKHSTTNEIEKYTVDWEIFTRNFFLS